MNNVSFYEDVNGFIAIDKALEKVYSNGGFMTFEDFKEFSDTISIISCPAVVKDSNKTDTTIKKMLDFKLIEIRATKTSPIRSAYKMTEFG